jgi:hypothetical protein
MPSSRVPYIDEHHVLVPAPPMVVWDSLAKHFARPVTTSMLARLLATEPRQASGTPLGEGATLPGFAVAQTVPGRRLRLIGRHRFSRYELIFTLAPEGAATVLRALTYAEFPGFRGSVYRRLVIVSGAHRVIVRRLLRAVRRDAEGRSTD